MARRREWAALPPLRPTVATDVPLLVSHTDEFVRSVSAQQSPLTRVHPADAGGAPAGRVEGLALVLPPPPPLPEPPKDTDRKGRHAAEALWPSDDEELAPPRRVVAAIDEPPRAVERVAPLTQAAPVAVEMPPPPPAPVPAPPVPAPAAAAPPAPGVASPPPPAPESRTVRPPEGISPENLEVVRPLHARRARPAEPSPELVDRPAPAGPTSTEDGAPSPSPSSPAPPSEPPAPVSPPVATDVPVPPAAPAAPVEAEPPPAPRPVGLQAPTTPPAPPAVAPVVTPPAQPADDTTPPTTPAPPRRRVGIGEPLTQIPRRAAGPDVSPDSSTAVPVAPAVPGPTAPPVAAPAPAPPPPGPPADAPAVTVPPSAVTPDIVPPPAAETAGPERVTPDAASAHDADDIELVHRPERTVGGDDDGGEPIGGATFDEPLPQVVVPGELRGVLGPPPGTEPTAPATTPWTTPPVRVQPVPQELRDALRQHGVDPGDAQVVRGWAVDREADDRSARAFTRGAQVFLPDQAGPLHEEPARSLLAHELTHVAQQRDLGGTLPPEGSEQGRRLEQDAREVESWFQRQPVASGRTTTVPAIPVPAPPLTTVPARPLAATPLTGRPSAPSAAAAGARMAGWDTSGAAEETNRVVQDLLTSGMATRGAAGELVFSRPEAPALAGAVQRAAFDEDLLVLPPSPPTPTESSQSSPAPTVMSMVPSPFEAPPVPPAPPSEPPGPGSWALPSDGSPSGGTSAEEQAAAIAAALAAATEAGQPGGAGFDIHQIAAEVGTLVEPTIGRKLRFELLRELRRELVVDRERKGRFLDD